MTLLYKKDDEKDLKNYRPLSIMNVDYKIFTAILMKRLTSGLRHVICDHQYAFLPGRLIDDNVRTIQYLIEKHEMDEEEGLNILFLDQEKAYDRVSHEYMWAVLDKIGAPEAFIKTLQCLYSTGAVNVTINGHIGMRLPVKSGVRQGDPISCPLYVTVIEPLALTMIKSQLIRGVLIDGKTIKNTLFADDTTVILRDQAEAEAAKDILNTFDDASGARVNWGKTFILRIGLAQHIQIPRVRQVNAANPYFHLGVPVGTDIELQLKNYWEKMVGKYAKVTAHWLKNYLSIKGRVLIANSLMMSLPRYGIRFLNVPTDVVAQLQKEYYKLVWDNRRYDRIPDLHACALPPQGGLGCIDLKSIIEASAISAVVRTETHPELAWVKIAKKIILKNSGGNFHEEAISNPFLLHVSSSQSGFKALASVWNPWRKAFNPRKYKKDNDPIITIAEPPARPQVMKIPLWYHPAIAVHSSGAGRWNSAVWRLLWDRGARYLKDIYNPDTNEVIRPAEVNQAQYRKIVRAVENLLRDLPDSWKAALAGPAIPLDPAHQIPRTLEGEPWSLLTCKINKKEAKFTSLNFTSAYKLFRDYKLRQVDYNERAIQPLAAYKRMTGEEKTSATLLWRAARDNLTIPKAGDLLWRLLHDKNPTGHELHWLPVEKRVCPIHGSELTKQHIFIDCEVAQAVTQEMDEIWAYLGSQEEMVRPTEMYGMMALMALGIGRKHERRRWNTLFRTAMWCLWKCYLSVAWSEPFLLWDPEIAVATYKTMVRKLIINERILALNEIYKNKLYSTLLFRRLWHEDPRRLSILKGPKCLRRTEPPEYSDSEGEVEQEEEGQLEPDRYGSPEVLPSASIGSRRQDRLWNDNFTEFDI